MEWWHIGLALLAVPVAWFLKLIFDYVRLSPEQKQGVENRLQRRKQINRYLDEAGQALRQTDALAQYPLEAGRGFRNRATIWRLQESFERMTIPEEFEDAHYALLRYFDLLLKEWDDDPLELNDPKSMRADSLTAREEFASAIEAALHRANDQYARDVWASLSPEEPFPGEKIGIGKHGRIT